MSKHSKPMASKGQPTRSYHVACDSRTAQGVSGHVGDEIKTVAKRRVFLDGEGLFKDIKELSENGSLIR